MSSPLELCYVNLLKQQMSQSLHVGVRFNYFTCKLNKLAKFCVLCRKVANDFSLKMHQNRLAAGLNPDPLEELTVVPDPLAGFN